MKINDFISKHNIPLYKKDSRFPEYYTTHVIDSIDVLNNDYLYSAEKLGKTKYSTKIDEYLGATKYVFFGLGKGYITKNKPSIGLIYNPHEIIKTEGVNLVENDLLYVLEEKKILNKYLINNWSETKKMLKNNIPDTEIEVFKKYLIDSQPLLVIDINNPKEEKNSMIFDSLLSRLNKDFDNRLRNILDEEIVKKYTIKDHLGTKINEIFTRDENHLNKYFDGTTEERMVEIRVPNSYPINKGLIGLYKN